MYLLLMNAVTIWHSGMSINMIIHSDVISWPESASMVTHLDIIIRPEDVNICE